MTMSRLSLIAAVALTFSWAGLVPADAHALSNQAPGVAAGLLHPLTGLDHLMAMLAIGAIASRTGGRVSWALPISSLFAMLIGASLGMEGVVMPILEPATLVSVVLLGVLVFGWLRPSNASTFVMIGLVGI